jgi:hypothetical protein
VQAPDSEGVAIDAVLESCTECREALGEALTEVRAGRPWRRDRGLNRDADAVKEDGRLHDWVRYASA